MAVPGLVWHIKTNKKRREPKNREGVQATGQRKVEDVEQRCVPRPAQSRRAAEVALGRRRMEEQEVGRLELVGRQQSRQMETRLAQAQPELAVGHALRCVTSTCRPRRTRHARACATQFPNGTRRIVQRSRHADARRRGLNAPPHIPSRPEQECGAH